MGSYVRYATNNLTSLTKTAAERASEYSQAAYERVVSATEQATQVCSRHSMALVAYKETHIRVLVHSG